MIGLCTAMLGMILIVALPLDNNTGRLVGYYLTQASPTPFVALLSLISSNVAGYTKKTTVSSSIHTPTVLFRMLTKTQVAACFLIGYCVGNIIDKFPLPALFLNPLLTNPQALRPSGPKTHRASCPPKSPSSSAGECVWASSLLFTFTASRRTRRRRKFALRRAMFVWRIRSGWTLRTGRTLSLCIRCRRA
jgi:hypothetical protein